MILLNAAGTKTLAALQLATGSDFNTTGGRIPITSDGVLFAVESGLAGNTPFVAQPGTYTLRLQGEATDTVGGFCNGTWSFSTPQLSYILLGTSA